jgi:hypothetical protein
MRPFLQFRGSRPGLFYDLSAGESYPLRISASGGLRFPPLISREKNCGLPPITSEKVSLPDQLMFSYEIYANNLIDLQITFC